MAFRINHIHVKCPKPRTAADWFVSAFKFTVLSDDQRSVGDRFVRCETEDGALRVNFSNARSGETLGRAPSGVHYGLEHFGLDSADLDADIARLVQAGATLEEGPNEGRGGQRVAFLRTPDDLRIELIQPSSN